MRRFARIVLFALVALALVPLAAGGAELRMSYRAMEKMMLSQGFDEEGRLYLQPALASKCRFVYLRDPVIGTADGRLLIQVELHTMVGVEVRGECIGTGDSFPAVISGVPVYRDGEIRLESLRVDTEGRVYGAAVKPMIDSLFAQGYSFPLEQRIAESSQIVWQETGVRMSVPRLEVEPIELRETEMRVVFDFRLVFR